MSHYMGRRLNEQVAWMQTFFNVASVDPVSAGLTQVQVDDFGVLNTALQASWATVQEPSTRTRVTLTAFHNKLKQAKEMAYGLVAYVQASPVVTDDKKVALGVTVRDKTRTVKPAPTAKPFVKVVRTDDRTVYVQLQQEESVRGKPVNVTGATIFTHLGPTAPAALEQWGFSANVTRTRVALPFPPSETGDTAWITAFWRNGKDQAGPACRPISVNLPAGGALPVEMEEAA